MDYPVENPIIRPIREPQRVGVTFCCDCNDRLFADETFLNFDGEHLCDDDCLKSYLGIRTIEGWEVVR